MKIGEILRICALIIILCVGGSINMPVLAAEPPEYQSASVLVMDAHTGRVLYETEGYARRYPASVVKVMTALLVLEHVQDLSEPVIFSQNAVDIPYYASRMWISEGESLTVREALYGILLPSGNEVARALAEHVSGSVPEFVAVMNRRATELGALGTRFVNTCGLPGDGQYITAYDIALIMREAIKHPVFLEIIAEPYFEMRPTLEHPEGRQIRNSNRMVRPDADEFNEYVIGGKTGFTNAAQHTLVTYARRGEHSLIISVLYAENRGTFSDTANLMDYVFAKLEAGEFDEEEPSEPEYPPEDIPPTEYPQAVPAFAPHDAQSDNGYSEEPEEARDIFNAEAALPAFSSLAIAAAALLFIRWVGKRRII